MRILTYKRTHIGDPNAAGEFGVNDCMGRVRNWNFDAVIGVGGYGREPQYYGIEGRITWVGLNPKLVPNPLGRAPIIVFESFSLLDEKGPMLHRLAPLLARRMYEKKARVLLSSYSPQEKAEAEAIVHSLLGKSVVTAPAKIRRSRCKTKKRCKPAI